MTDPRMPGVPDAQQVPQLRRYPLRRLRLPVGRGQVSLVVPDERAWVRQGSWASAVVRGEEPPYWVRIWPAALATARALARVSAGLAGARVLDLGCGLGLPGVVAAGQGASVTFADLEPDALAFACWNARHQPGASAAPAGVQVDWRTGDVEGAFDVLVLSDVSYHQKHHGPLRRHLARTLDGGGVALHADPHRDLATTWLRSLDAALATSTSTRDTRIQDRRADVRLTWIARDADSLVRWQQLDCRPPPGNS